MGVTRSIQFKGIEAVVLGYRNRKVAKWAIFQDKDLLFVYDEDDLEAGAQYLETVLESMNEATCIFTLKVYEDIERITDKTPCVGSFGFRITQYEGGGGLSGPYRGGDNIVLSKLTAMEKDIKELKEGGAGEADNPLGMIGHVLDHPVVESLLPVIIGKVMEAVFPEDKKTTRLAGVHNAADWRKDAAGVEDSLSRLSEYCENVPGLLRKLAELAEKKPGQFKMYVTMLNSMKL